MIVSLIAFGLLPRVLMGALFALSIWVFYLAGSTMMIGSYFDYQRGVKKAYEASKNDDAKNAQILHDKANMHWVLAMLGLTVGPIGLLLLFFWNIRKQQLEVKRMEKELTNRLTSVVATKNRLELFTDEDFSTLTVGDDGELVELPRQNKRS